MENTEDYVKVGTAIGCQRAFAMVAAKCSAAQALTIKRMKESCLHDQLGLAWNDFCPQHLGISRVTADRIIAQLNEFGETYFRLGELTHITENEYRQIATQVSSESIQFDGESIPLTPENAPRIRQAVHALRAELRKAQTHFPPRSNTINHLQTRLDALLEDMKNLNRPLLPDLERAGLRGLAHYAVEKWSAIARAYEKAA